MASQMKGKKINHQFVEQFMTDSINSGLFTPQEIIESAKSKILEIDNKIKEAEILRKSRCNLLDVVYLLEKDQALKETKVKQDYLNLFKLSNNNIAKSICDLLTQDSINFSELEKLEKKYSKTDIFFSFKELCKNEIIFKDGDIVKRGTKYSDYMKIVFLEG